MVNKDLTVKKILHLYLEMKFYYILFFVILPYNKWINTAATTFGVLMIHANSNSMRKFLWIDLFDTAGHYHSSALWLYASAVVIVVYVVCVALDCLRITFIEKPFFEWLDQYLK